MKTFTIKKNQSQQIVIQKSGDYRINLVGEGAKAEILGAFWSKGKDIIDIKVTINHQAKHTSANTLLRAIAQDQSLVNLSGTIIVDKNAQQTNSFLAENILLLSVQAKANATPNLEIEANDVKCSHAATVSNLDENQVFYLQSRGVNQSQAKTIIANGFLDEVYQKIKPLTPIR